MSLANQKGDTIIEVILATAMLGMVTVSSFAIMQRASSSAYDAMERSAVRLQLTGQVELLNYFRDAYADALVDGGTITGTPAAVWDSISDDTVTQAVPVDPTVDTCSAPADAFYLAETTTPPIQYELGTIVANTTGYPKPGQGLWIVKSDTSGGGPLRKYQEFYVIACWRSTTSQEQRMSSVVRLYDPRP